MNAAEILAIPDDRPEKLFGYGMDEAKEKYRLLAKQWHPDRNPDGDAVFAKVTTLFRKVEEIIARGVWRGDKGVWYRAQDGKQYHFTFLDNYRTELCEVYVGNMNVAHIIKNEYSDIVDSAVARVNSIHFASSNMEKEMSKYLPMRMFVTHGTLDYRVWVQPKEREQLPLRLMLNKMGGRMPPEHVAWILSTAYNNACYFDAFLKWVHGGFAVDNYFVNSEKHEGGLLSGWWYVTNRGMRPKVLPVATLQLLPKVRDKSYKASYEIDSLGIKTMGLELLGSRNGSKLLADKSIPGPLLQWLRSPPLESAVKEYHVWKESVLPKSFGKPKFVELDMNAAKLYEVT